MEINKVEADRKLEGIFWVFSPTGKRFLATRNLVRGFTVSGERLVQYGGHEYRLWEPSRSKLAAAIVKGLDSLPIKPGSKVLYLGAANGVTSSYVSDIVGKNGLVYCVEFSAQSMEDLIRVCLKRENMLPILADARFVESYRGMVDGQMDVVYEDVADKEQDRIMIINAEAFLKKNGSGLLAVKARCVDSAAPPRKIYDRMKEGLAGHFEIEQAMELEPFEKDHEFLSMKYLGQKKSES